MERRKNFTLNRHQERKTRRIKKKSRAMKIVRRKKRESNQRINQTRRCCLKSNSCLLTE
jgi:hypothetical protein